MTVYVLLVLSCLVLLYGADDTDILCTTSFCSSWLEDNTCTELSENCQIQNQTHNGVVLPYAGPCHCCDYCVTNLGEGDSCSIGTAASPIPRVICGDLLTCAAGTDDNICEPMDNTDCTKNQKDYDARRSTGKLGHLEQRANCQRRGLYEPYKCIPGEICYCVNEEGHRIFGDMPFTILAPAIMNCACSRANDKAEQFLGISLYSTQYLRCKTNGDYDQLQCIDDECFCVHAEDGTLAINPTNPVNISSISNSTLGCFDNSTHVEGEYYRDCEVRIAAILAEIAEYEAEGYEVIGYNFPSCSFDGYYATLQTNATHKYCSDRQGNILENFIVTIDELLASDMDCNCARSRNISEADKPNCCRNGNYNPMQCRRGLCRCVDMNGHQISQEVSFLEKESLTECNKGCVEEEEEAEEEDVEEEDTFQDEL